RASSSPWPTCSSTSSTGACTPEAHTHTHTHTHTLLPLAYSLSPGFLTQEGLLRPNRWMFGIISHAQPHALVRVCVCVCVCVCLRCTCMISKRKKLSLFLSLPTSLPPSHFLSSTLLLSLLFSPL